MMGNFASGLLKHFGVIFLWCCTKEQLCSPRTSSPPPRAHTYITVHSAARTLFVAPDLSPAASTPFVA